MTVCVECHNRIHVILDNVPDKFPPPGSMLTPGMISSHCRWEESLSRRKLVSLKERSLAILSKKQRKKLRRRR